MRFQNVKMEGGWISFQPLREDMGLAMAIVRKHKDRVYDLTVKEHREKRSLDSNRYAWILLDKISIATRIPKEEIYQQEIRRLGGNSTTMCVRNEEFDSLVKAWESNGIGWVTDDLGPSQIPGCRNVICYHGSSTYDTQTMARFIDNLIQSCKQLDIEVLPPEKIAAMKEEWM